MKKFTNLLGFALLLNLLGFIALIAYRVNFDIPATLQVMTAFGYSAVSPFMDIASVDLMKGLQWFAVLLYTVASFILVFISIKSLNFLRIIVSPLALTFSLSMILIVINGYYIDATSFDNLGAFSDFWALLILPIQVANPGLRAIAFSGLITTAVLLTLVFHIFVIIDSFQNPYVKKQGLMIPINKEETLIADELSNFVLPSQIKVFSPIESTTSANANPSTSSETQSLLNSTPIVVVPSGPSMSETSDVSDARQTVLQIKEKIRALIRLQLLQAQQALAKSDTPVIQEPEVLLPVEEQEQVVHVVETPVIQEIKPQEDANKPVQQPVKQVDVSDIDQLESKDQVTTLINEELIKYDSLNREVMESLVAEKIEQLIGTALDQYKQEVVLMGEKTLEETKAKLQSAVPQSTQSLLSNEELHQLIQQMIEQNPSYKKLIDLTHVSEKLIEKANDSSDSSQDSKITSTEIVNLIQSQTFSQEQIQQLLDVQQQKLLLDIKQFTNKELNHLMTRDQFNQALNQLTQTKQDLINQHQDIMTLKDVVSQFQAETLSRIQPLQEKVQQSESNKVANIQIKPVEEAFIVALMQKHLSKLKSNESLEVISSIVATEVKKQTSEENRINTADVEKMIADAVAKIPQSSPTVMPKVMSEGDINKLVESKLSRVINEEEIKRIIDTTLPKQATPVVNDVVISSMVAAEVKKQTSEENRINTADVEKMIADAVAKISKPVYIQENTGSTMNNANSSYYGRMVSPSLTIPVIRKKNAKAPDNEKRAAQFKSVVSPDIGVTRTGKKKIIRIPFQDRMSSADPMILSHYDELKNYILSFQVKSRISNVGDIFRLHKEVYVKITIAGKGLKLYLALNPEDYKDGPIPVDDASDKKMYKDIPLVFKVKSELSLKRAKKLIDDLMAKKGLPQKEIPFLPWSKAFQK